MGPDTLASFLFLIGVVLPVRAMDCSFGTDDNVLSKLANSCPRPLVDSKDEKFCCFDTEGKFYCCEGGIFALYVLVGIVIILIPLSAFCCIICCLWRLIRPRCH